MQLLLEFLEQPHNWLYSFFIIISILIWLITSLGIFHTDSGADISHELSADVSTDGFLNNLGDILGFGMIPTSVMLTIIMFVQGIVGIFLNEWGLTFLSPIGIARYALLGGNFLISLFVGSAVAAVISRPLRYVFKDYGTATRADSVIGKIAQVTSGKVNAGFGQATLKLDDGNTIEIAVRTAEESLSYGQKLLILDFDKEKNVYLVEKYD